MRRRFEVVALAAVVLVGRPAAAQEPTAAPAPESSATVVESLPVGDPIVGKALFTGTRRFANGAPPCMACHSVAGIGALGGGALGPDLTTARERYGEAGLAAIVQTLPFPTMQPIFGSRPLTPDEQAHVRTFLMQAVAARPTRAVGRLGILAVAGAVLLLLPIRITWRRRLEGVREPLLRRQRTTHQR